MVRRLPIHALDPAGGADGDVPTISGGKFVLVAGGGGAGSTLATVTRTRVGSSTAATLPTATNVTLPFDTEAYDTDGLHDPVTNPTRITLNKTGVWLINAQVGFSNTSAGGRRIAMVMKNGSSEVARGLLYSASNAQVYVSASAPTEAANVGDYLELLAYQDSGQQLSTAPSFVFMSAVYLGP